MNIGPRCVVSFHYTLTNASGEVLDSSSGGDPLAYLHGTGSIVKGLEQAMEGRAAGDKFSVVVAPEEGYGPRMEALVQELPASMFEGLNPEVGMRLMAESNMGPVPVMVTAVSDETVTLDGNHELAGVPLHFAVEITAVREATVEEVMHGHAHGAGGHHH